MFLVCYHGTLSTLYEVLSIVPKGSVLGPLLFSLVINNLCSAVKYSNCLLFADDIKIRVYWEIKSPYDRWILQQIWIMFEWYTSNYMKLNVNKTTVISSHSKTNCHDFDCKLSESSRTASGISELLQTQSFILTNRQITFSLRLSGCWG
jgi:hypothetical protein